GVGDVDGRRARVEPGGVSQRGRLNLSSGIAVLRDRHPVRAGAVLVEERDDVVGREVVRPGAPGGTPEDRDHASRMDHWTVVIDEAAAAAAARTCGFGCGDLVREEPLRVELR